MPIKAESRNYYTKLQLLAYESQKESGFERGDRGNLVSGSMSRKNYEVDTA